MQIDEKFFENVKFWLNEQLEFLRSEIQSTAILHQRTDDLQSEDYRIEVLVNKLQDSLDDSNLNTQQSLESVSSQLIRHSEKQDITSTKIDEILTSINKIILDALDLSVFVTKNKEAYEYSIARTSDIFSSVFNELQSLRSLNTGNSEYLKGVIDTSRAEFKKRDKETQKTLKDISDLFEVVSSRIGNLKLSIDRVDSDISSLDTKKTKEIEEAKTEIFSSLEKTKNKINYKVSSIREDLAKNIQDLNLFISETKSTNDTIQKLIKFDLRKKLDLSVFDSYIEKTKTDIEILKSDIECNRDFLSGRIDVLETDTKNTDAISALKKKIRKLEADVATKQDTQEKSYNWEFKFHPVNKGILLYKREDQTEWKSENLNVQTHARAVYIGGGGPSKKEVQSLIDASKLTVMNSTILVEEKTDIINIFGTGVVVSTPSPGVVNVHINTVVDGSVENQDQISEYIYLTSDEILNVGDAVRITSNKHIQKTSNDNILDVDRTIGLAAESATIGQTIKVLIKGYLSNYPGTFLPGKPFYLDLNGQISQTYTYRVYQQVLGYAISSNEIYVDIKESLIGWDNGASP